MAFTVQAFYNAINLVRCFVAWSHIWVDIDIPTVVPMVQLGKFLHLFCMYRPPSVVPDLRTRIGNALPGHLDGIA